MLDATPILSEFVANNDNSFSDGNQRNSDWIEIFNTGDESIDLRGWYLTDDASDLTKWEFPSLQLLSGEIAVVFASGDDRPDSMGFLHTNFRLSTDGEYLGLVQPDGQTIANEWMPNQESFPPQFEDISMGFVSENRTLVSNDAAINWLVPSEDDVTRLDLHWTGHDEEMFDAVGGLNGWSNGENGIGHKPTDTLAMYQQVISAEPSLLSYFTFDADHGDDGGIHDVAGSITKNGTFKYLARFDERDCDSEFGDGVSGFGRALSLHGGGFVELGAVQEYNFEDESGTIEAWLLPTEDPGSWFGTRSDLAAGPGKANRYTLDYNGGFSGITQGGDFGDGRYTASVPIPENEWVHVVLVFDRDRTITYVNGERAPDTVIRGWSRLGNINSNLTSQIGIAAFPRFETGFHGSIDELAIYDDPLSADGISSHYSAFRDQLNLALGSDIHDQMAGVGSSAYVRIPFELPDEFDFSRLEMNVRYSDGFIAYLNGQEVARRNISDEPIVAATQQHDLSVTERFNVSSAISSLRTGQNMLAIHGVNLDVTDPFFFVQTDLVATSQSNEVRFFSQPTPGRPNAHDGVLAVVSEVEFSQGGGIIDNELDVSIAATTPGATLVYTLDGSAPSLVNGELVPPPAADQLAQTIVSIDSTTNLRASAFLDGWQSSQVTTATYILLRDINDFPPLF